ncbi:MAG: Crp/Fnr family transcriptional regulator [bacterium]|nr:Crp/Fnr family transcriptional regulator [bacterium]
MHSIDDNITKKIDVFFSQFTTVDFEKSEIIIRPNKDIHHIFLLKKGLVRMYSITEDGIEATIHIFRPNSFFPMMLRLSNIPNKYYFEAMNEVEAVKAPEQQVIAYVKNDPELLYDLTTRFAAALNGLMLRIEQLVSQSAYAKIISLLLYFSQISGENRKNKIIIDLKYSHDDIGAWVGVARETVSRQMEKLEKKGLISQENHFIVIEDMEKLKQELTL